MVKCWDDIDADDRHRSESEISVRVHSEGLRQAWMRRIKEGCTRLAERCLYLPVLVILEVLSLNTMYPTTYTSYVYHRLLRPLACMTFGERCMYRTAEESLRRCMVVLRRNQIYEVLWTSCSNNAQIFAFSPLLQHPLSRHQ